MTSINPSNGYLAEIPGDAMSLWTHGTTVLLVNNSMRETVLTIQLSTIKRQQPIALQFFATLVLLLGSPAWGLGLGEISYQSSLGEPLQAKIDILIEDHNAYSLDNIRVRQIGPAEADKMGFELVDAYYGIRFTPVQQGKQFHIELSSSKPVKEPYINMLVEVRWPQGSVYREYTVLLDPPTAPAVSVSNSGQSVPSPLPVKAVTATAANASTVAGDSYRVKSGDSLYAIARRVEVRDGQSVAQMMDWILQHNPQAFVGGDRNRLRAGVSLSLPSRAQMLAAGPVKAVEPVVAATAVPAKAPAQAKPVDQSKLSLEQGGTLASEQLSATPIEDIPAAVIRAHINAAQENNERLKRENEQLRNHMKMLEASDYIGNLEKLIALKDQQIAALAKQTNTRTVASIPAAEAAPKAAEVERPSLLPVKADTDGLAASNKGWWAFYAVVMAALLGFLYYFLRNRKTPDSYSELVPASLDANEEQAMLEELDELANQYRAADNEDDGKLEAEDEAVPDFVAKATGGRKPTSAMPGRNRRPDEEVMRDIEKRIQSYSPTDTSKRVMQVPEQQDDIDNVISESLVFITAGKFDLAEAMLLEADFETRGKEGRLTDALEYLNYCRTAKGNRSAS